MTQKKERGFFFLWSSVSSWYTPTAIFPQKLPNITQLWRNWDGHWPWNYPRLWWQRTKLWRRRRSSPMVGEANGGKIRGQGQLRLRLEKIYPRSPIIGQCFNLVPLISRWEINKFENCWYNSVRISEVLKLLFRQFLNLSSFQGDMSGPILGNLSNSRWSGGIKWDACWAHTCNTKFFTLFWQKCTASSTCQK